MLLKAPGDAQRGGALLTPTGKAGACLACHFVAGNGRDFGPDLSKVGSRLSREQILESLIKPSVAIADGFGAVTLTLQDKTVHMGFVVKETPATVTMKLPTGQSVEVQKAQISSRQSLPVSLMPEGQLQAFTAQEAADLIAYLAGLK